MPEIMNIITRQIKQNLQVLSDSIFPYKWTFIFVYHRTLFQSSTWHNLFILVKMYDGWLSLHYHLFLEGRAEKPAHFSELPRASEQTSRPQVNGEDGHQKGEKTKVMQGAESASRGRWRAAMDSLGGSEVTAQNSCCYTLTSGMNRLECFLASFVGIWAWFSAVHGGVTAQALRITYTAWEVLECICTKNVCVSVWGLWSIQL